MFVLKEFDWVTGTIAGSKMILHLSVSVVKMTRVWADRHRGIGSLPSTSLRAKNAGDTLRLT